MILNDLIGLAEILRKLASGKAELDEKYFESFIRPIWDKFEKIHADYKNTFREYLDQILDEDSDLSVLQERIRRDTIYSQDLRLEIREMVYHIPPAFPKTKQEFLDHFLKSLGFYFNPANNLRIHSSNNDMVLAEGQVWQNHRRYQAIMILARNGKRADRKEIIKGFDSIFEKLQSDYGWVSQNYQKLKKELLT